MQKQTETIRLATETKEKLRQLKPHPKDSFDKVINILFGLADGRLKATPKPGRKEAVDED